MLSRKLSTVRMTKKSEAALTMTLASSGQALLAGRHAPGMSARAATSERSCGDATVIDHLRGYLSLTCVIAGSLQSS